MIKTGYHSTVKLWDRWLDLSVSCAWIFVHVCASMFELMKSHVFMLCIEAYMCVSVRVHPRCSFSIPVHFIFLIMCERGGFELASCITTYLSYSLFQTVRTGQSLGSIAPGVTVSRAYQDDPDKRNVTHLSSVFTLNFVLDQM